MMSIKIVVAIHKECKIPKDDLYLPVQVGKALHPDKDFGYQPDNEGENISEKNSYYSELTALYWAWKNLDCDYIGLAHYRRYFVGNLINRDNILDSVITYDQIKPMLGTYKVFVPKKRRYYIETLYSHYAHTHDENHLKICRKIIEIKTPDYIQAFDIALNHRWGYMFNMMILQKNLMDDYCSWLFDILFELEKEVDTSNMSDFDKRFFGRISELLFNVWIEKNLQIGNFKKYEIRELPYMEDVNWKYKVKVFLMAKFLHKKYGESS